MRDVPLRVLMLEDRPTDAERILHGLREAGFTPVWQCVQTETEYLGALDPAPDIVLVDSDLAAFDPLRTPQLLHERGLDIPCIVVSGPSRAARGSVGVQPEAAAYPWNVRLEYAGQAVASVLEQRGLRVRQQQAEVALSESEQRFQLLVENIQDYAIFMLDPAGRVISWNNGAERIKGYRAEEIIGQHFARFYTAEDRTKRKPARVLQRARAKGQFKDEGWRVRKDGTRFWADVVLTALCDEAGQLCGFAKVTRDMTERRQAEEALRASERRFRELLQHMQLAAVMLDTQGRLTFCNDCLLQLTGYRVEEVIGQD
ncbi:MAG: PAS domain S-box protein, partial [Candidatus Entotheonellia bacterium]